MQIIKLKYQCEQYLRILSTRNKSQVDNDFDQTQENTMPNEINMNHRMIKMI